MMQVLTGIFSKETRSSYCAPRKIAIKRTRSHRDKSRFSIAGNTRDGKEVSSIFTRNHIDYNVIDVTQYGVKGYGKCTWVNICTELCSTTNGVYHIALNVLECNIALTLLLLRTLLNVNNFVISDRIINLDTRDKSNVTRVVYVCVT